MKFTVTLKDPDGVFDSISRAAEESINEHIDALHLDEDEREAVREIRHEKLSEFAGKWLEYGEYATIEFDTEAGTAVVVKR